MEQIRYTSKHVLPDFGYHRIGHMLDSVYIRELISKLLSCPFWIYVDFSVIGG
ncbi:hypothetical protein D3C73_734030 [compost metagenome]